MLRKIFHILYMVVMLWIGVIVVFMYRTPIVDWCRKWFLLPNELLALIGLAIFALLLFPHFRFPEKPFSKKQAVQKETPDLLIPAKEDPGKEASKKAGLKKSLPGFLPILIASLILLTVQLIVSYNVYYETGWDAGEDVINDAWKIAQYEGVLDNAPYYSMNPNNAFILFLFGEILRFCRFLGITGFEQALFVLVILQCVLSSLTGFLLFRILKDVVHSGRAAWFGWGLYVVLIGLSPWMFITYTDGMGLVFPLLMVRLYQTLRKKRAVGKRGIVIALWALIFLLSYWGYKIKATVMITLIGIILLEVLCYIEHRKWKEEFLPNCGKILLLGFILLASELTFRASMDHIGLDLDDEVARSPWHYMMMGLNEEHDGAFNFDDSDFSMFIPYKDLRRERNMEQIALRVKEMFPLRLLQFYERKTILNFHDGTFAYGVEGNFYMQTFPEKNACLSPFLRSIFWDTEPGYPYLALVEQTAWILTLLLCLLPVTQLFRMKGKNKEASSLESDMTLLIRILVLGSVFFVMLFEARARYLYDYVPLFIASAVLGADRITLLLRDTKISSLHS